MLDELYAWLESYSGASFDFDDAIRELDNLNVFIDPFNWKISIETMFDQLDDAIDVIDEFKRAIPTDMPNRKELKRLLTQNVLSSVVKNVRTVSAQINLTIEEINTLDKLKQIVQTIYELITMFVNYDINDILKRDLFGVHEENNDDSYNELLGVSKEDLSQIAMNINAIRDSYYDALDSDEDMM